MCLLIRRGKRIILLKKKISLPEKSRSTQSTKRKTKILQCFTCSGYQKNNHSSFITLFSNLSSWHRLYPLQSKEVLRRKGGFPKAEYELYEYELSKALFSLCRPSSST